MCIAYSITSSKSEIGSHFGVTEHPDYTPRYNARPAQLLPVITAIHRNELSYYYWGTTPNWSKQRSIAEKLINVRSEGITEMPAYLAAYRTQRCLVPANSYFGWKQISKKGLVPYRFMLGNEQLFAFAGIWEEFENNQGNTVHTFAILTTTANDITGIAGGRMPVILEHEHYELWLNQAADGALTKLLQPIAGAKMGSYAVGNLVNNIALDIPEIIKPAPPADQFGNYSLFD